MATADVDNSMAALQAYHGHVCGSKAFTDIGIVRDDRLGRHLVAKQNFQPGDVIVREMQAVAAPKSDCLCVCCLRQETGKLACSRCGWPICEKCAIVEHLNGNPEKPEENKQHQTHNITATTESAALHTECDLLAPLRDSAPWRRWRTPGAVLSVLRCLQLRQQQPDLWHTINSLQDNVPEFAHSPWLAACLENIVTPVRDECSINESVKTVVHIAGMLDTNCFSVLACSKGGLSARALYPLLCLMAHDCSPNTNRFYDAGVVTLVATQPICAGDVVTTSYTSTLWGTHSRRAHLAATKFFHCICRRCEDPSELGTNVTAIVCRSVVSSTDTENSTNNVNSNTDDNNHKHLQQEHQQIGDTVSLCGGQRLCRRHGDENATKRVWECQQCGGRTSAADARKIQQLVALTLEKAMARKDAAYAERWATAHREVLGPNHFFLLEMELQLVELYALKDETGSKEENQINRHKLTKHLLDVTGKLEPGPTRLRGKLLCHLVESSSHLVSGEQGEHAAAMLQAAEEAAEILRFDGLLRPAAQRALASAQAAAGQAIRAAPSITTKTTWTTQDSAT